MPIAIRAYKNNILIFEDSCPTPIAPPFYPPSFFLGHDDTDSDMLGEFISGTDWLDSGTYNFVDYFTDTDGVRLDAHTPDVGGFWSTPPWPLGCIILGNSASGDLLPGSASTSYAETDVDPTISTFAHFVISHKSISFSQPTLYLGNYDANWEIPFGIQVGDSYFPLVTAYTDGDSFRLEIDPKPGIHLGARHAYKSIFGRTAGPCNPENRDFFEAALLAMQNNPSGIFIIRTVNMTNGAFIDEVVSALIY